MSRAALERLQQQFPEAVLATHAHRGDETALIAAVRLFDVCQFLKADPELQFDMLIDVSCVDTLGLDPKTARALGGVVGALHSETPATQVGAPVAQPTVPHPAAGRFQVVYHLRSSRTGARLRLKVPLDEGEDEKNPEVQSLTPLYKSADWGEREVWDMFGIRFKGHPDLRRILMYEEFVGHPLRKDYPKEKHQPLVRRDFT